MRSPGSRGAGLEAGPPGRGYRGERAVLITTRFVFIHIPKTGGDFLRRLCVKHIPA
jgi:hypothetical protein